jgi:MYXO-CTERM domain-containing protein
MTLLPLLLALSAPQGHELDDAFRQAASDHQVPLTLLQALGWEATRWDQTAHTPWEGWGVMDLMEGSRDPSLEHAAVLLDVSPDLLIHDAGWNIQGGAALLAWHAREANGGELPDAREIEAWWDALRAFSRSDDPEWQALYADTLYRIVQDGFAAETAWGPYAVAPTLVDTSLFAPVFPPPPTDYAGAYQFISASSSNYSNYSRTGSDIRYVIVHTVQGSYSGCISWFQNSSAQVSAHYVIRSSDGQITQMVWEEDVAWHAGNWDYNLASIGLEHEGYVDAPGTWYTDAMYASSAALVADIVRRTSVSADRSHILAHSEVPGATHTDPGSGWDWDYYMALIQGGGTSTGTMRGIVAEGDIYHGERIVGASVWLDSGESTTSAGDGSWSFSDLPYDTYTVYAEADGYQRGSCTKAIESSSDHWCSIALEPIDDPPVDTGEPPDTTDDTGDPSGSDDTAPPDGPVVPGTHTRMDLSGGCGCSGAPVRPGWPFGLLALLGVGWRARRRGEQAPGRGAATRTRPAPTG